MDAVVSLWWLNVCLGFSNMFLFDSIGVAFQHIVGIGIGVIVALDISSINWLDIIVIDWSVVLVIVVKQGYIGGGIRGVGFMICVWWVVTLHSCDVVRVTWRVIVVFIKR